MILNRITRKQHAPARLSSATSAEKSGRLVHVNSGTKTDFSTGQLSLWIDVTMPTGSLLRNETISSGGRWSTRERITSVNTPMVGDGEVVRTSARSVVTGFLITSGSVHDVDLGPAHDAGTTACKYVPYGIMLDKSVVMNMIVGTYLSYRRRIASIR